jgi:hypothetical protein
MIAMRVSLHFTRIISVLILGLSLFSQNANALPPAFDPQIIFNDSDFYNLPDIFVGKTRDQSISILQGIMAAEGSVLSTSSTIIRFYDPAETVPFNEDIDPNAHAEYASAADRADWDGFMPSRTTVAKYLGRTVSIAEFIWMLSQEDLADGNWGGLAINERINPLYVLSVVQKESGLVYGNCSKATCYNQSTTYRILRATGYYCFDGQPCNAGFLGFFKQVFFSVRWHKAFVKKCNTGFTESGLFYKKGSIIPVDGQNILLTENITCANYFYTPHLNHEPQYNTFKDILRRAGDIKVAPVIPVKPVVTITTLTTSTTTPTISGTVSDPTATLSFNFPSQDYTTSLPNIAGKWSYTFRNTLAQGIYQINITATAAGLVGTDTSTNELTITQPASAPPQSTPPPTPPQPTDLAQYNPNQNTKTRTNQSVEPEIQKIVKIAEQKQYKVKLPKDNEKLFEDFAALTPDPNTIISKKAKDVIITQQQTATYSDLNQTNTPLLATLSSAAAVLLIFGRKIHHNLKKRKAAIETLITKISKHGK